MLAASHSSAIQAKICGITTEDALDAALSHRADFIGFVFYPPSPRSIAPERAKKLSQKITGKTSTVAVIVDLTDDEIDAIFKHFIPHYLQLHGEESMTRVAYIQRRYGLPVIKAINVRSTDDIARGKEYSDVADMLLFDAKVPSAELPGGNGVCFDWTLLKAQSFRTPWFLSGGLNVRNIEQALSATGARMVDASSGLESEPGIKDPALIAAFLEKIRR